MPGLSMQDGAAFSVNNKPHMSVCEKWARMYAPSRVAPQEESCPSSIAVGRFFVFCRRMTEIPEAFFNRSVRNPYNNQIQEDQLCTFRADDGGFERSKGRKTSRRKKEQK